MIHGIISDGSFFASMAGCLKDDYRVISYDRRGYGRDDPAGRTDFSVGVQAKDAAGILGSMCPEGAWVFGNSAGGLIAIELALKYPQLVKGLILLEPSLIFDEESKEEMRRWNEELNGYLRQGRIKKALPAFARITGQTDMTSGAMSLADMKQIYHNLQNFMQGELNEVQHYFPPLEEVRRISCPAYVLVSEEGGKSMFARTSMAGAAALGWPVVFTPGRHNAVRDLPEQTAQTVRRILCEARGRTI